MKIAGRKNAGAWFRTNRAICGSVEHNVAPLSVEEKGSLNALLQAELPIIAMFDEIQALAAELGVDHLGIATMDAGTWTAALLELGIPLQIWMGKLTFTTYTRTGAPLEYEYSANHQAIVAIGAKSLRKVVTKYLFGRREIRDIFNFGGAAEGNPSGYPNTDPNV